MLRSLVRGVGAAVLCVAVASCGSNVTVAGNSGDSIAYSGSGGAPGVADETSSSGSETLGATQGTTAPEAGSSGQAAGDASSDQSLPPTLQTTGTQASTKPLQVGIPYISSSDTNTFTTAIGGSSLQSADPEALYRLRIAAINKAGGINGRKLVPIFEKLDASSTAPTQGQVACEYMTQDHHADVVLSVDWGNVLYPCLAKKGVPTILDGPADSSAAAERSDPYSLWPTTVAEDRLETAQAAFVARTGWLTSKHRLGVLYYDDVNEIAGFNALKQSLPRYGLKVYDSQSIHPIESEADVANVATAVKAAELRFKSEGVDRLICVEQNAFICGFAGIYGAQQGYYPKYAYTSNQPLTNVTTNVPPKALAGAVFMGWFPAQDLQSEGEMPASEQKCIVFYRKAGIDMTSANEKAEAVTACEDLDFLAASAARVPSIAAHGLTQGAIAAGPSYHPDGTFTIRISSTRRDGAAAYRPGAYVPSCNCFRYNGAAVRF